MGVDKRVSLDKLEVIKREITTATWVSGLEGEFGRAELVVSIDEDGQHCF